MIRVILKLYRAIRLFIQPYYDNDVLDRYLEESYQKKIAKKKAHERPKQTEQAHAKKETKTQRNSHVHARTSARFIKGKELHTDSIRKVLSVTQPLSKIANFKHLPKLNTIWSYTSSRSMQLAGVFEPGAGYVFRNRNARRRKTLRPKIYPLQDKPFDRTHLLPFGFTRSENDDRLLVGWDSNQNRNELNDFEQMAKRFSMPIIWLTVITHSQEGLHWSYRIYSCENRKLLAKLDISFNCRYKWLWRDNA